MRIIDEVGFPYCVCSVEKIHFDEDACRKTLSGD